LKGGCEHFSGLRITLARALRFVCFNGDAENRLGDNQPKSNKNAEPRDFKFNQRFGAIQIIKERIMKRFLILAAVMGGLTFAGFASTANAGYGWRGGGNGHGGYGRVGYGRAYGYGYGYGGWGRPYGYGYRPGVFIGTPGIGIGFGTGYAYPAPYAGYGYGYPYGY
jgi:hypothetical protein